MKILIITDNSVPGLYRSSRADVLARGLTQLGHDLTVLCSRPALNENLTKEGYDKIKIVYVSEFEQRNLVRRAENFLQMAWKLKHLLKYQEFDVLRATALIPAYVSIKCNKNFGYPVMAELADFSSEFYRQFGLPFPQVTVPIIIQIEKEVVKKSDLVIVETPIMRETWRKWGLREERGVALPSGIDKKFASGEKEEVQKRYNLGNEKIVFFHGDITPLDGVDILVKATKMVVRDGIRIKTMIVGKGAPGYMNFLRKIIRSEGLDEHFIFTGWVPHKEIPDYLSCADVCVHSCRSTLTTSSNVTNKVLEYIGANKPVIASEMPGLKMMFPDAFFYVPPESPQSLSRAIVQILSNDALREKLIVRTKQMVQYYYWEKIVAQEEKLMQILVNGKVDDFRQFDWQLTYYK